MEYILRFFSIGRLLAIPLRMSYLIEKELSIHAEYKKKEMEERGWLNYKIIRLGTLA